jgi:hypothetical protein
VERCREPQSYCSLQRSGEEVSTFISPSLSHDSSLLNSYRSPSDFYTAQDIRTLLNTYITSHSLPNPTNQSLIRLDPLLNSLLVASNENVDNMKREEMVKRLCGKMQPWYAISQGEDGEKVVG